jgi:hypothetical protein
VSFGVSARRVRDASRPFDQRVRWLRSCVRQTCMGTFHETLRQLEAVAGRFQYNEQALLRAVDVLADARRRRDVAHQEYAARRRIEKRAGRRRAAEDDPDPGRLGHWITSTELDR